MNFIRLLPQSAPQKQRFSAWLKLRQLSGLKPKHHKTTYAWTLGVRGAIKLAQNLDLKCLDYNELLFWGWKSDELAEKTNIQNYILLHPSSSCGRSRRAFNLLAILSAHSCISPFSQGFDFMLELVMRKKFRNFHGKTWFFVTFEDTQPITLGLLQHVKKIGHCTIVTVQHGLFNIKDDSIEGMNSDTCFVFSRAEGAFLRNAGFMKEIIIAAPFRPSKQAASSTNTILFVGPGSEGISHLTKIRKMSLIAAAKQISIALPDAHVRYRPHPSERMFLRDITVERIPKHLLLEDPPYLAIGFNSTLLFELHCAGTRVINLEDATQNLAKTILERLSHQQFSEYGNDESPDTATDLFDVAFNNFIKQKKVPGP